MSARTATDSSSPVFPFDGVAPCQPWKAHTARLTSRWLTPSVAAITAHGEIDASNAGNLADYARGVLAHCLQCRCLILDLGALDFLGTEGISTMDTVRDRCAHGAVRYALVPSAAVSRVLRICDPAGAHVAADTVDAALAALHDHPDRARHSLAAP